MMKFLIVLALMAPLATFAQDGDPADSPVPRSCSAPEYRQFDFWTGDWDVTVDGQPAGTNSIRSIHNGCALRENWQGAGAGGISGSSFNIYDRATGRWHQTWVDSSGTLLQLDGGMENGAMVMSGQRPAPDGKGRVVHRISWTPLADGTVRQLWEVSNDQGDSWTALFDGTYSRISADS